MAIPVQGYPDYLIGEDGRIWSKKTHKYLKPAYTKTGYASVELFNSSGSKRLLIHRLVARAFIPNPLNLPQVNHIDEDPRNNSVDNLEWCTAKYNMNYGNGAKTRHVNINYSKPIYKVVAREKRQSSFHTRNNVRQKRQCFKIVRICKRSKQTNGNLPKQHFKSCARR